MDLPTVLPPGRRRATQRSWRTWQRRCNAWRTCRRRTARLGCRGGFGKIGGKLWEDMENILENDIGKYNHRKIYRKIMGNILENHGKHTFKKS